MTILYCNYIDFSTDLSICLSTFLSTGLSADLGLSEDTSLTTCFYLCALGWGEEDIQTRCRRRTL